MVPVVEVDEARDLLLKEVTPILNRAQQTSLKEVTLQFHYSCSVPEIPVNLWTRRTTRQTPQRRERPTRIRIKPLFQLLRMEFNNNTLLMKLQPRRNNRLNHNLRRSIQHQRLIPHNNIPQ